MPMLIRMLEKISDEKSKRKNIVIEKFIEIIIKTIGSLILSHAKYIRSVQKNIQY